MTAERVALPLRPVVWVLAVVWLGLSTLGRGAGRSLELYERGAEALGRAVGRGCRAVGRFLVRVLGPLGRLLRRLVLPVLRLVRRVWDRLGLWLLLRLLRPLGRLARWLLVRLRPLVQRITVWGRALLRRVEPVLHLLSACVDAVERAATRLSAFLRRVSAPVARAVAALRPSRVPRH